MTVGDLFAGIGGFSLGLQRAGFEIAWQVEIDEWCRKVLAKHFPHAKRLGDIRNAGKHNLSPVDLVCGGFPCQPFSTSGKREGAEDDRYLWPEMLRVISELKPSWVVAENVHGLTTGKMAPVFEQVLSDLENEGYEVQSFIIPACGVDAPHRRYRVWIVAYSPSKRRRFEGSAKGITEIETRAFNGAAGTGSGSGDVANTEREQLQRRGISELIHGETGKINEGEEERKRRRDSLGNSRADVANTPRIGDNECKTQEPGQHQGNKQTRGCGGDVSDTESREAFAPRFSWESGSFNAWPPESGVGRVVDGVSARMDGYRKERLRGLGNAVVPQIPELFGRIIMQVEQGVAL